MSETVARGAVAAPAVNVVETKAGPAREEALPAVGTVVLFHMGQSAQSEVVFPAVVIGHTEGGAAEKRLSLGVMAHTYAYWPNVPAGNGSAYQSKWWSRIP